MASPDSLDKGLQVGTLTGEWLEESVSPPPRDTSSNLLMRVSSSDFGGLWKKGTLLQLPL